LALMTGESEDELPALPAGVTLTSEVVPIK
jgi:hypothetical protein